MSKTIKAIPGRTHQVSQTFKHSPRHSSKVQTFWCQVMYRAKIRASLQLCPQLHLREQLSKSRLTLNRTYSKTRQVTWASISQADHSVKWFLRMETSILWATMTKTKRAITRTKRIHLSCHLSKILMVKARPYKKCKLIQWISNKNKIHIPLGLITPLKSEAMNSCRYSLHKLLRKMFKLESFRNKLRSTQGSDPWDLKMQIARREREARQVQPLKLSSQEPKNSWERGKEKFKSWKMKMLRLILRTTVKKSRRRKSSSFKARSTNSSRSLKKWKMN